MKNKLKIYQVTLKRLLIPAVIMGALLAISTVLYLSGRIREVQYYGYGTFFRGRPTSFAMAPGLPVFMILGAAVMTYMAFSYLNKRNASDFYHALPYTRVENVVMRFLAVMTYQIGIILLTLLVSFMVLVSSGTPFTLSFYPLLLCGYAAGSLLVAGAVLMAMSVTGTLAANVLVSGLVLFLPRMILFILGQSVISLTSQRILLAHSGIFLNPAYNLVTGSLLDISRLWEYYGISETLVNPGSIIYTAILGAVYFGLAVWLMKKRKSELAGRGAVNPAWECIFGALASLPILLVGINYYLGGTYRTMTYQSTMTILIVLAIALVVYLIIAYMMSTRWKMVLKSLPLFAAAIVIAIGVMLGANLTADSMATKLPARDKITSISIDEETYGAYRKNAVGNYNTLLAKQVKFTDPEVVDRFYEVLKDNNEDWQKQRDGMDIGYVESTTVLCEYKLKSGKSLYRNISIKVTDIADMKKLLLENEAYYNAYTALAEDCDVYYYDEDVKDLYLMTWEAYKDEFNSLSERGKLNLNLKNIYTGIIGYSRYGSNASNRDVFSTMVYGELGSNAYTQYITVSYDTPKTADFYMEKVNDRVEGKLDELLKRGLDGQQGVIFDLSFVAYGETGDGSVNMFYNSDMLKEDKAQIPDAISEEQMDELVTMILGKDITAVSVTQPYMRLQFSFYGQYMNESENYEVYIPLSSEDIDILTGFVKQNRGGMSESDWLESTGY